MVAAALLVLALGDSLRGHVQVVGVAEQPTVTLVPDRETKAVLLNGPVLALLAKVDGLVVDVIGTRAGRAMAVTRFAVVAANGLPATDGRLVARGDTLLLVTADGVPHALVRPSPVLRAHVGGRVWVSGRLDREPVAYGIIQ
jgi:hypothetical protein